jgi:hypothetical protein
LKKELSKLSSYFKFLRRVRIHGRECGAVARALRHKIEANPLSAVDRKVLSTTNERKVMSKTTFFKRIALTAIAALGFGMLSVAPSQAVAGAPTLTAAAGSASGGTSAGASETGTAASVTITGLLDAAGDSYTVAVFRKSAPTTALADTAFRVVLLDTATYSNTLVDSGSTDVTLKTAKITAEYDSKLVSINAGDRYKIKGTATGYVGAKFGIIVDSATDRTGKDGAYVFTVQVTPNTSLGAVVGTPVSTDVTLTINKTAAAAAEAVTTVDPSKTKAVLNAGTGTDTTTADAVVSKVATSSTTTHATIQVNTYNVGGYAAAESITVTLTGPGLVGDGTVFGKSLKLAGDGTTSIQVRADGTAGTASIVVATTTVTFPAKTVTFYALAPSTVVASVNKPVIAVGTTAASNDDVVRATFKDANGNIWGGDAYIYATDDAVAGDEDGVLCTFDSTDQRHECDIDGLTKGTTTFKVMDADEAADATVTSDALSVRVSTGVASSVVLSFDKATYAPGEKAQLRVSVLDGEGLSMPGVTITNALATGGITSSRAFGSGSSDEYDDASFTLSGSTSAAANTNAGHKTYVVYMPATAGALTVSALGGTGIAAAGRVALTATATVVDTSNDASIAAAEAASDAAAEAIDAANAATDAANLAAEAADAATVAAEEARDAADAATAAVEALATEVATLMAALKAQITTLANTVAKIAKKVKA